VRTGVTTTAGTFDATGVAGATTGVDAIVVDVVVVDVVDDDVGVFD
jgi:hypothetical protein